MEKDIVVKDKYVTFKSGEEYFGIKIDYVNEIIVYQDFTEIPESESFIKGLINLRGKIIPVIDVRLRFNQDPFDYNDRTVIIVLMVNEFTVGLIVEKIADVVELGEDDILPAPSLSKNDNTQEKFVFGIGKLPNQVVLLLDQEKLIGETNLENIDLIAEEEEEGDN